MHFPTEPPKELHISRSMTNYLLTLEEENEEGPHPHAKPQHRLSFSGTEKTSQTPTKLEQKTPLAEIGNFAVTSAA